LEAENNMHARSLAGRRRRRNKNSTWANIWIF
jgi:hypothetical protein